jgi:hypothetical protein
MPGVERCLECGYVLIGLPEPRCPECGLAFDFHDPSTYSTKPLFVRWKYWLPGFAVAAGGGALLYLLLLTIAGWGVAVTIVAPFCVGAVVGYGCRAKPFLLGLLALGALGVIAFTLFSADAVGVFCGTVLVVVALLPVLIGTLCGFILRVILKGTSFDQRWHLPALMLLVMPLLCGVIERAVSKPHAIESVVTSIEIPAPVGRTWNALMFYEEVHRPAPWLLRYGLPRPLYATGSTMRVGATKVCIYSKGHLSKRVTRRVPRRFLAFDVIEQDRIENHSIRPTGGSFALVPQGTDRTRVWLTTRYQPKLGPRWIWRPFEKLAVHTLHQHVLEGMRLKALDRGPGNTLPEAE